MKALRDFGPSFAALCLTLAACSSEPDSAAPTAEDEERIPCAINGGELNPVCSVERAEKDGKLSLVVRHPDGGFRRFDVLTDGRGLAVADGAEEAQIRVLDSGIDVTVGADHYIFPAKVKPEARATDAAQ